MAKPSADADKPVNLMLTLCWDRDFDKSEKALTAMSQLMSNVNE